MDERKIAYTETARPASKGRVRMFLDALGNRLFPQDPVLLEGKSGNPPQEMLDLVERMGTTRNSRHLLLYSKRLLEVSRQLSGLREARGATKTTPPLPQK